MMDEVITKVCMIGMGRLGFARVLIELNAEKNFKDVIEIAYRKSGVSTSMTKYVQVEYAWRPTRCSYCCVFRHDDVNCRMIPKEAGNEKPSTEQSEKDDGFQKVTNRKDKNGDQFDNNRRNVQSGMNGYTRKANYPNRMAGFRQNYNKQEYKAKKNARVANKMNMESINVVENHTCGSVSRPGNDKVTGNDSKPVEVAKEAGQNKYPEGSSNNDSPIDKSNETRANGGQKQNKVGIIRQNRYSVLESMVDEEVLRPNNEDRKYVDSVLETNVDPTVTEWDSWNEEMKMYYKGKKELIDAVNKVVNEEDVVHDLSSNGDSMLMNEIKGVSCNTFN
ncbi:zinc knuckle CX2CX4HX4C [Artemisia annua]|uniref:Zinc knuckle CX2CX4HX4C n=1 Tax=Artemisia annua TaxID=35608 RepID=A0A2U1NU67_ARTAN|nr:zinc knuckle CX2CX4HX4C [Artemisia annua]